MLLKTKSVEPQVGQSLGEGCLKEQEWHLML
jgi:hypothetical protein